jgi:hypothetical protein
VLFASSEREHSLQGLEATSEAVRRGLRTILPAAPERWTMRGTTGYFRGALLGARRGPREVAERPEG